jgi:hypothetical protein
VLRSSGADSRRAGTPAVNAVWLLPPGRPVAA